MTLRDKLLLAAIGAVLLLAAAVAFAGPTRNDVAVVADGGVSITLANKLGDQVGPSMFDFAADGTASVKFLWFKSDLTARGGANLADSLTVLLRDYTPPRSFYWPSGPDSLYVDLGTATEVIVTR